MKAKSFPSFSDLYRAAFAETNAEIKQLLLAEVKKSLDDWEQTTRDGMAPPVIPVASVPNTPVLRNIA
jgi:hypothetical protein